MNILIVEDDVDLAVGIVRVFRSCAWVHRVHTISSPLEFSREMAYISSYDMILTDLRLTPDARDLWGYRVIEYIRARDLQIPIIVMSGQGDIDVLRHAFDLGATDYLIKPFRLKELHVRVEHWFKRYCLPNVSSSGETKNIQWLVYHSRGHQFSLWWDTLELTRMDKCILSLFLHHPWELLSHSFLEERIWWDRDERTDRNIRIAIFRLRKSLRVYHIDHWISTIRGEGYQFDPS
jgi:DNA-binding response OmpR family regulator